MTFAELSQRVVELGQLEDIDDLEVVMEDDEYWHPIRSIAAVSGWRETSHSEPRRVVRISA